MKSCTGRGRGAGGGRRGGGRGHAGVWAWAGPQGPSRLTLLSSPSYEVQLESKVRRKGLGKFLIQILQLMANRKALCVCVCVCVALGRSCVCCMSGKGGGDKAHRNVLEEGYLEPPCPAVTPHLVQWAQGNKHPQVPVLCVSTGTRRRSQSGGEQPCLRVAVRLPSGAQEHSQEQTGDSRRRQERIRAI